MIKEWPVDRKTGALLEGALDRLLTEKTKLIALTQCSNVCSIVHDIPAIVKKAHARGALVFVDGSRLCAAFPD